MQILHITFYSTEWIDLDSVSLEYQIFKNKRSNIDRNGGSYESFDGFLSHQAIQISKYKWNL